ncbi:MAG: hypothetical protein JSW55_05810 [Chloroflexota bacterium]|nr:MAG: hypothetical protein JSW55_05810 [Chloroflexota bacterium]
MSGDLKADSILAAEFEYIAQTAFQTNEDRAKVSTMYVLTVGSFLAAMLGLRTDLLQTQFIFLAFAILFALLSLNAGITLLQLVRLRQAWYDSVQAMNQIKDYYVHNLDDLPLDGAFRWRQSTLPVKFKPWSVSFLMALQVTILGGAAVGATMVFAGLALLSNTNTWLWILAGFVGLIYAVDLIGLYWYLLRDKAGEDGA